MSNLIKRRVSDDERFFIKNNFAFGFRRLAILNLSYDIHETMHYLSMKKNIKFRI